MKRMGALFAALVLALVLAAPYFAVGETAPPDVTADAYLVMDAATGQILIEKNSGQRHYPASITKIMTMALAMAHCGGDLSQQVTVSYEAVHALEYGSSHVALQPDEEVTLRDLFYATVLASANDAANVLAEYTAGSMEAFAGKMNEQAAALGMESTHFVNANGLHDDAHYTTARDMAVLTRWAMTVPGFNDIFGATEYTMQPTNKQSQERFWGTDNCMLVENVYQYDGTLGGKSGWTNEAGYTMVEVVERGGRTLICVVMGCDKKYDKFSDCIALFDYCFDNFAPVTLTAAELELPMVPVYYDANAPSLGSVPLSLPAGGCTFLMHTALHPDDVAAAFAMPDAYLTEQPFAATMTLSLRDGLAARSCMYAQIGQYDVSVDPAAVDALLNANAKEFVDSGGVFAPETSVGKIIVRVLLALLGAALALAVLVALRIAYVAWVKAQRKKRRLARRAAAQSARRPTPEKGGDSRKNAGNRPPKPVRPDEWAVPAAAYVSDPASVREAVSDPASLSPPEIGRMPARGAIPASGPASLPPSGTGQMPEPISAPDPEAAPASAPARTAPPVASAPPAPRRSSGPRHAAKPFRRRKAPPPRHARR